MDNELKEIVGALAGYEGHPGWRINKAQRQVENGESVWTIEIQRETEKKEAADDND